MTAPVRLLAFALLLVAAFVLAFALGSAVGPVGMVLFGAGSGP